MNKTQIDCLKNRIVDVVRCTNGTVATILNEKLKNADMSNEEKYELIKQNKAELKPMSETTKSRRYVDQIDGLLNSFEYPITSERQKAIQHNKSIENKKLEIMAEIELEGKRILDSIVLGILKESEMPNELVKISNMVELAKSV